MNLRRDVLGMLYNLCRFRACTGNYIRCDLSDCNGDMVQAFGEQTEYKRDTKEDMKGNFNG